MKIGLIGINMHVRALNYACPLHVFAFQQFLLKHGIESTIIDYLPNTNKFEEGYDPRHPSKYFGNKVRILKEKQEKLSKSGGREEDVKAIKAKLERNIQLRDGYNAIYKEREERYDKQWEFIEHYLIKTDKQYNCALLEVMDPGFDCYICVTDIIWDKFQATGYEPGFFLGLSCMENKWKIAYSASKLVTKDEKDKEQTSMWIKDMDFVSVREDFLQRELQDNIRSDVACVLDPVLLHDASFYEKILVEPQEKGYLLLYYVVESNPEIIINALDYAKKHQLKIIELTDKISQNNLTKQSDVEVLYKYGAGIQEWIGYFRNAECVFTNSFHGCCLSILFQKSFYVGRRNNYDKITALLRSLDLTGRITDDQMFCNIPEMVNNWETVRKKLEVRRAESEYFILNALAIVKQQSHPQKDYYAVKKTQRFPMYYNIGKKKKSLQEYVIPEYQSKNDQLFIRKNSIEFFQGKIVNDGLTCFHENVFQIEKSRFAGWRLRIHVDYHRFYLLEDGSFQESTSYWKTPRKPCKIFQPGDFIPSFPLNRIQVCVAEATWVLTE